MSIVNILVGRDVTNRGIQHLNLTSKDTFYVKIDFQCMTEGKAILPRTILNNRIISSFSFKSSSALARQEIE